MLLDKAARLTFGNLSTLFLLVGVIVLPLHLIHAYVFRAVIAVSELHSTIENFSKNRQVRGVGVAELSTYRISYLVLGVVELALLFVVVRAVRRVVEVDADGGVPGLWDALKAIFRAPGSPPGPWRPHLLALAGALVFAVVLGVAIERAGLLLAEPLGPDRAFVGTALAQAVARALAAPFFAVAVVVARSQPRVGEKAAVSLY